MDNDIWVICDNLKYDSDHSLQLITKAAQLSLKITAICIGKLNSEAMERLFSYGATKVLYSECENDNIRVIASILKQMIISYNPGMIMFLSSSAGKYLASVSSTYFESGLTADCIDIAIDIDNEYVFSRAALNSSVIAKIKCQNSHIRMCTVKRNVFSIILLNMQRKVDIERFEYAKSSISDKKQVIEKLNFLTYNKYVNNDNWMAAKIVFAIGRGVSNKSNVDLIKRIALKCGAEIVGTRAAVEENLIKKSRQVGQSGVNICPNIYVGLGVSGASQHMVGIKNAKMIIAINSDENAPIFQYADYMVVDDLKTILTELNTLF
ncbi:electron transfer flavoprotein subunit alpha/FixB family protein [Lacrimispora algidixylanolytica]|nr:electron transfer flavoprotein subunit alpha/FixB family protein [Lacrimispora algidixylanolytica]